ncbi:uncharacterized protein LOC112053231 isoform X1 [Bicyclus anynana]|uniref:Uncharacterized protein LOC112053231 isoform X1 n=1 Tax=Bicyclus anynana TaxID=110368 RepID=A0A6J1NT91_BICAN|nr:uncharacterized protein LOC112053231 isoform X1 [Bicyclus anynana]
MGDLIEFSTWPRQQNIFHKLTSGAIAFSVKGETHAAVGLAKNPSADCEYWVIIGHNECWLNSGKRTNHLGNNSILCSQVFTKFWISWDNSVLQFGRTHDGIPLIRTEITVSDIQYVTFSAYNGGAVHWKLYLPPKLERLLPKKVQGGLEWIKGDNILPNGALIGGYEKEMLYIIRAEHEGSLTPGKFVPSLGLAIISWGDEAHVKSDFEVLCGYNCIWVPTSGNIIPAGAVVAGYSENTLEPLYVGRVVKHGHLILGKVLPSHKVCYFPYKDKEFAKQKYEILVNPEISMDSPNCYDKAQLSGDRLIAESYIANWEHARNSEYTSESESE